MFDIGLKSQAFLLFSLFFLLFNLFLLLFMGSIRVITSVCAKDSVYFTQKPIFLFYTITFTKHQRQFIYYTHFFIKIIFSLTFFIISHLSPLNFFL